jgi:hypothetical protein
LFTYQVVVENEFGFHALQGVFQAVSPVSLRPADVLLKVLFVPVHLVRPATPLVYCSSHHHHNHPFTPSS